MLTSLRKSSLVPDFLFSLLQLFTRVTVHSARYLLHLNTLLVSVCSEDLLICFADHWRGEWDWCVGRHFHEFYFFFSIYYFFFLYCFLPTTFYPHPLPTPTTHYPQHLVTLSLNRAFSRRPYRVSQNNKMAAMLVFQTIPLGVDLFSYVNTFFGTDPGHVSENALLPNFNYRKLKEPFLPDLKKCRFLLAPVYCTCISFILSAWVSFQRLELQCITQDLLQTSVNLRGDDVVFSVCRLIQSCPVMPTNCSINFKHLL